jgi:hypothetical protein
LSNNEAALQHFKSALDLNFKAASTSWSLYAAFDLANVLREGGESGDKEKAESSLQALIQSEAANYGMTRLAKFAPGLRSNHSSEPRPNSKPSPNIVRTNPSNQSKHRDRGTAVAASESLVQPIKPRPIFRRENDFWLLGYEEKVSRVRHRKGLALIFRLLQKPHEAIHVVELASMAEQHHSEAELQELKTRDMGPLLDSAAKDSYRERARDLREELEQARQFNDLGRVAKVEEELQFLTRELARAINLFGRDRAHGSSAERARLRVTNAIKYAITRITTEHEPLALHLNKTIKTGFYCVYRPDVRLDWEP